MIETATQPESSAARLDDLAEMIQAFNAASENVRRTHEALLAQVVRLEEQLASKDAQLQRSERLAALGEMAAGIAHEVRNPLAAIQLYASMLVEDLDAIGRVAAPSEVTEVSARGSENALKIISAVRGLDSIVTDVLSFSRDMTPRRVETPIPLLFHRAVETQLPAIEMAGVLLHFHYEDPSLFVSVDRELVQQALTNLVRNAVQAMSDDERAGCEKRLTLSAKREGPVVVLEVRDSGPGVPAAVIDRIFNPFFTTRGTGTGLGLAIVHRIVDAHGGAIAVYNVPGCSGGAVFELRLPLTVGEDVQAGSHLVCTGGCG